MTKPKDTSQQRSNSGGPWGRRGMPVEKAKDFKGSMRKLSGYIGSEWVVIFATTVLAVTSTVLAVFAPRILAMATDEVHQGVLRISSETGGIDLRRVGSILLVVLALHVFNILFNYFQGFIMAGVSARITYKLRRQLSQKIHRLPLKYFDKTTHGDVLSRITNDVDTLSNTLSQGMGQLVMSFVQVMGILIMMLLISPILALVAMLLLPLSGICVGFIVKKSQKYFKQQQESLGKLNGHVEEMFTSHAIVKSFGGEDVSVNAFDVHNDSLYHAGWRANFLSGLMMPIIGFIGNITYVAIVVIGGALAIAGRISIGGIQAFIQYTRQFGQPVAQLAGVASVLQQTAAAAERVFAFLGEEEEPQDAAVAVHTDNVTGHVVFDNVCFGYDVDIPVIKNFSAKVAPGQKIAIVGHTGAGKTTIVKLLMRFYDISQDLAQGQILVDGENILNYTRNGLRKHFGMVLQDTWLFSGTIADNIRYGKLDATDDDVERAAKAAQAHHFISTLPDGYQMQINEEADNISAGQKQLLTIARTILSAPDILILDEATSNVDTRTELLIQRAMDTLMKGRTSFVIAHRLSTIRSADMILVMQDGDIVEQGTHDQLILKNGVYTGLYNSQFDTCTKGMN